MTLSWDDLLMSAAESVHHRRFMAAPVPRSDVRQMAAVPPDSATGGAHWRRQPSTPQQAEASTLPYTASTAADNQPSITGPSSGAQSVPFSTGTRACNRQAAGTKSPVARLWRWLSGMAADNGKITAYSRGYSEAAVGMMGDLS